MYMAAFHCFKWWNFITACKANRTRKAFAIVIDNSDGINIYSIENSHLPRYISQISVSGISVVTQFVFGNGNGSFPKGIGIQRDPAYITVTNRDAVHVLHRDSVSFDFANAWPPPRMDMDYNIWVFLADKRAELRKLTSSKEFCSQTITLVWET